MLIKYFMRIIAGNTRVDRIIPFPCVAVQAVQNMYLW
jgi:multisubunit Na+/H+ antiporter MnhF subunit